MDEGFTFSYRKKWANPVFRSLLEAGIWAWMCDAAAWKETRTRFNGEMVTLQRGQLITSRRFISEGFSIGEQVTRTFLENLENDKMISQQPTRRGTIITICNYDEYQSPPQADNPQVNQQPTSTQPTANPNNKEEKKDNKVISSSSQAYPPFRIVFDAGTELFPHLTTKDSAPIHQWLNAGCDLETDILATIRRMTGYSPNSWGYFTRPIMDAKATRERPPPEGVPRLGKQPHATLTTEEWVNRMRQKGKLTE